MIVTEILSGGHQTFAILDSRNAGNNLVRFSLELWSYVRKKFPDR